MMPYLMTVRIQHGNGPRWWIPLPLLPVALVLSPVLLIASVAGLGACLAYRVSPGDALRGAWGVVRALPGTRVDLQDENTALLVSIR